eukprot:14990725-Alexandrium_andersonii.AAC.1
MNNAMGHSSCEVSGVRETTIGRAVLHQRVRLEILLGGGIASAREAHLHGQRLHDVIPDGLEAAPHDVCPRLSSTGR